MMSKTQTVLVVLMTILAGLLLTVASLQILPFGEMNNLLVSGWLFPLLTTTVLIVLLRGYAFKATLKLLGGLLLVSIAVLLVLPPL